jgi:hypothetical protein
VILRTQNRTETAQAADNNGPKRREPQKTTKPKRVKPLKTTTKTAQAAENKRTETAQAAETKESRKRALQHDHGILRSNGETGVRKPQISNRKANESKGSVSYTKLDAFVQLRLGRSQGTEVIRKSGLPFSLLGWAAPVGRFERCKVEMFLAL